jgi:hypothetical protein
MNQTSRKSRIAIAILASLAAPLAFANGAAKQATAHAHAKAEIAAAKAVQAQENSGLIAQATKATPAIPPTDAARGNAPTEARGATPAVPATPPVDAPRSGTTPATPATPPSEDTRGTGVGATPATPATPAKKSWAELDVDANGTLSATEAASLNGLAKVFVQADANADGQLSQDEYKAWLSANGKGKAKASTGG